MLSIIANALWITFDASFGIFVSVVSLPLTRRHTCAWIAGAAVLVVISVFAGIEDWQATKATQTKLDSTQTKLDSLNGKASKIQDGTSAVSAAIGKISVQLAAIEKKPGLKKDALELARTLIDRSGQVLALAAQHGAVNPEVLPVKAFPESLLFKTMQKQWNDQQSAHEESVIQRQQLMSDYKNTYASEVVDLHQQFIAAGQDWNDEQYYANPADIHEILNVGLDLFQHANRLN
jgi:hypothetical protein